jgi:hypothetical protein
MLGVQHDSIVLAKIAAIATDKAKVVAYQRERTQQALLVLIAAASAH